MQHLVCRNPSGQLIDIPHCNPSWKTRALTRWMLLGERLFKIVAWRPSGRHDGTKLSQPFTPQPRPPSSKHWSGRLSLNCYNTGPYDIILQAILGSQGPKARRPSVPLGSARQRDPKRQGLRTIVLGTSEMQVEPLRNRRC